MMATAALLALLLSLLAPGASPPPSPSPRRVPVFSAGLGGIQCFRIPAIVPAASGALVAFAEARPGVCKDDWLSLHIASRRSTDAGRTWSPLALIAGNASHRANTPMAFSVRATPSEPETLRVTFSLCPAETCHKAPPIGNGMVSSTDGGMSWGDTVDLSAEFGAAKGWPTGPGSGIQLREGGPKAGRLIATAHTGSAVDTDFILISDDRGAHWRVINQTIHPADESMVTELPSGVLLLNARHNSVKRTGRAISLSTTYGESWGPVTYDERLTGEICQASIVTFNSTPTGPLVTYFSNPRTPGRLNLSIRKVRPPPSHPWPAQLHLAMFLKVGHRRCSLTDCACGRSRWMVVPRSRTARFWSRQRTTTATRAWLARLCVHKQSFVARL